MERVTIESKEELLAMADRIGNVWPAEYGEFSVGLEKPNSKKYVWSVESWTSTYDGAGAIAYYGLYSSLEEAINIMLEDEWRDTMVVKKWID